MRSVGCTVSPARRRARSLSSCRRLPRPVSASVVASCARQLEEAAVLAERHCEAHDDEHECRRGEDDREHVHADEVVVDEDARRDERADGRDREQRSTLDLEAVTRAVGHPGGRRDEEQRSRPEDVDPRSFDIRAFGRLEEVDGVRERRREDAEARGAASADPASTGEREDAEDGGQQEDVTERVREVRDDDGGRALGALERRARR